MDHLRAQLPYKTSDFHALISEQRLANSSCSSDTEVEDFEAGKTIDFDERVRDDGRSAALEEQRASAQSAKFASEHGKDEERRTSPH